MFSDLEDHGLPLVQVKERRRDLVVALMGQPDSVTSYLVAEIAALQQTIAAIEAVITDLDAEHQSVDHLGRRHGLTLVLYFIFDRNKDMRLRFVVPICCGDPPR